MSAPKESVIRKMTRLAVEHNAVNLSQGITDEPVVYDLAWAGISAILGGSDRGTDQLSTLTLQALLDIHGGAFETHLDTSLKDLLGLLQPERDRFNQYSFPFGLPELRSAISDTPIASTGFARIRTPRSPSPPVRRKPSPPRCAPCAIPVTD